MNLETTLEDACRLVDQAFNDQKLEFNRKPNTARYEISNFNLLFKFAVNTANNALFKKVPYYAQEMPYRETGSTLEYLMVFHRDDNQ
ncbi:hypothetical protein J4467_03740 [Candidatus Woesearchaeota archaeon]|nr:hypothetical protein [Candidatus Woesearchaeota archaeon]